MKVSLASFVSMTTAASMTAAEDDAPLLQKDIGSDIVSAASASAVGDTSSLPMGIHHHPTASTHVRESMPRSDNTTAAVATSALLHNKEHTSGGGNKNVDVDVGLLPISERLLNSVQENCAACTSRPKIESGTDFKELVSSCYPEDDDDPKECPNNVPIGCWDTSEVTDMAYAFLWKASFDDSINCWNTARVTDMSYMFRYASNFNQPLNNWDVASVTDMRAMLFKAYAFNQPLDDWNVASVTDMGFLFYISSNFNQPLNDWDVASVNVTAFMFQSANNFNQPLDDWDVASVTTMKGMFNYETNFNQPLDDWDVASVNNMQRMFNGASNFNQPLDDWNVASVTDMNQLFNRVADFNQCLSTWADKTPPNVSIDDIFDDSGCPNKDAKATVSPWCQGADEQCLAPSATPSDFPSFLPTDLPSNAPTKKSKKSKK